MTTAAPTTTVFTADGRSLDLYMAGPPDGDRLAVHSGTPSVPLAYGPSVDLMAERGLRYVAFSRAGYGSSTRRPGRSVGDVVDDARVVLDHVGAERVVTIGWSGGGPHALACAALLPDRIRAVATLASVAPYPADGLDYLAGMGAENVEEFTASLESSEALIAFKERNWPIFRDVTADEVREAFRESYWGWFDDDMAMIRPWGFELASIGVPVHIWQGRHDRMVPFAHGEWLAAHLPTAIPHLFDERGHLTIVVDSMGSILDELVASGVPSR